MFFEDVKGLNIARFPVIQYEFTARKRSANLDQIGSD